MQIEVNGQVRTSRAHENSKVVHVLRNELGLPGVRAGCAEGHCGACMVLVDGLPTRTCDLPLWAIAGKTVLTPEGVGTEDAPHPVQRALLEVQAGQCGFCLSGILMTAVALCDRAPAPTEHEVRAALDHHLCRCGSQQRILTAVLKAVRQGHAA